MTLLTIKLLLNLVIFVLLRPLVRDNISFPFSHCGPLIGEDIQFAAGSIFYATLC